MRQVRDVMLNYFRALSRSYPGMSEEAKVNLVRLSAYEAHKRWVEGNADDEDQLRRYESAMEICECIEAGPSRIMILIII